MLGGNCPSGNCPVGNCPGGNYPEWELFRVGKCPGGSCPRMVYTESASEGYSSPNILDVGKS